MVFFHNVSMDKWKFKTTEVCVSMYISSVCVCVCARAFVSPCLCVCLSLCLVLFSLFSLCFSVSLSFFSLCLSISFLSRSLHLCLSLSPLCVCCIVILPHVYTYIPSPLLPFSLTTFRYTVRTLLKHSPAGQWTNGIKRSCACPQIKSDRDRGGGES